MIHCCVRRILHPSGLPYVSPPPPPEMRGLRGRARRTGAPPCDSRRNARSDAASWGSAPSRRHLREIGVRPRSPDPLPHASLPVRAFLPPSPGPASGTVLFRPARPPRGRLLGGPPPCRRPRRGLRALRALPAAALLALPLLFGPAPAAEAQTAPAAPAGLTATAQIRSVRLSWTNPNNSDITGWQYRRGTGDPVSWGSWTNFSGPFIGTTIPRDISGLTSGTEYSFQVRALAGMVQGAASDTVSATPLAQAAAPAKPAGLAATAGSGQVTLNWTDPSNAAITAWQFRQRAPPDTGSWGNWLAIASSTAATTTHTVTGLTNGTAYEFQIRARAGCAPAPPRTPCPPRRWPRTLPPRRRA